MFKPFILATTVGDHHWLRLNLKTAKTFGLMAPQSSCYGPIR